MLVLVSSVLLFSKGHCTSIFVYLAMAIRQSCSSPTDVTLAPVSRVLATLATLAGRLALLRSELLECTVSVSVTDNSVDDLEVFL